MKKLLLIIPAILIWSNTFGQQIQQYSQYIINQFVLNPAVAGTEGFMDVYLGYRHQWAGFEGAPVTYYLSAHKTVGKHTRLLHKRRSKKYWHGIGAQVFRDNTGPLSRTSVLLAYAYNFPVSGKARLSVGSFFGVKQLQSNGDYWENIYDTSDPLFNRDLNSGLTPEVQLGGVLYHPYYFVNISVMPVLNSQIDFEGLNLGERDHFGRYNRHMYLSSGLRLEPNRYTMIIPSIMLKYVQNAPLSLDMNVKISHEEKFWYGASFRFMESVNAFAGVGFAKRYSVSYAFEWSLTAIGRYIYGTHEIILGMKVPPPTKVICPDRYW